MYTQRNSITSNTSMSHLRALYSHILDQVYVKQTNLNNKHYLSDNESNLELMSFRTV